MVSRLILNLRKEVGHGGIRDVQEGWARRSAVTSQVRSGYAENMQPFTQIEVYVTIPESIRLQVSNVGNFYTLVPLSTAVYICWNKEDLSEI